MPEVSRLAWVPVTVQTEGVVEAKLTGRPELAVADRFNVVPAVCDGIAAKVIVCEMRVMPVPLKAMTWVAGLPLSALSVSVAVALSDVGVCGVKEKLRLHSAPGAREKPPVQSAGVPEPATRLKSVVSESTGLFPMRVALPKFCSCKDCGLSLLVVPTTVGAKLSDGGAERTISSITAFPPSVTKMSPAESRATVPGWKSRPLLWL